MTRQSGTRRLICCVARMPSQLGRPASSRATSGLTRSTSAIAWRPSAASPTTMRSSSLESTTLTAWRKSDCSSASSTRITPSPSATPSPRSAEPRPYRCENAGHALRDVDRIRQTDHADGSPRVKSKGPGRSPSRNYGPRARALRAGFTRPRRTANAAASSREWTWSFDRMPWTCVRTVFGETSSSSAIWPLVAPSARSCSTSISRVVSCSAKSSVVGPLPVPADLPLWEHGLAVLDAPQGALESLSLGLLREVAVEPGLERILDRLLILERGQRDDLRLGQLLAGCPCRARDRTGPGARGPATPCRAGARVRPPVHCRRWCRRPGPTCPSR